MRECGQGCHSGVTVSTLAREVRSVIRFPVVAVLFRTPFTSLIALEPSLM